MGLTWSIAPVHAAHAVDEGQFEPELAYAEQAREHVQDFIFMNIFLDVQYTVTPYLGVSVQLPMRSAMIEAEFLNADGETMPNFTSIHHRDENLFGLGDLRLGLFASPLPPGLVPGLSLVFRAGISTPTGNTEPDPFALGGEGKEHQHIFFGTGTVDPYGGMELSYRFDPGITFQAFFQGKGSLYRNTWGYLGPGVIHGGLGIGSGFGLDMLHFRLQLEAYHEIPALWDEKAARNSGRTDLMVSAGITWSPDPMWQVDASVQIPVATWARGGQLTMPAVASLGLTFSLDTLAKATQEETPDTGEKTVE